MRSLPSFDLSILKNTKKPISTTMLIALIVNILAPAFTFAAALPTFSTVQSTANVVPVAEVVDVVLPRDPVAGDILSITINGSTVTQGFMTSTGVTAGLFNFQLDALPGVASVYDSANQKFIISSRVAGTSVTVGNLTLVRAPILPNTTVNNVVAIAEQSEVTIPQSLFSGDVINFTVAGTGITQAFTGDTIVTLTGLADQITTLTSVSGSYDVGTQKLNMISKVAGSAFSMSNFVVSSNGIPLVNINPNVVPVAQTNVVTIPRTIYPDETLLITVSGATIHQSYSVSHANTLAQFVSQLDVLSDVDVSLSGSQVVITSATLGIPFVLGSLTISGAMINSAHLVSNRVAVAQIDAITVPRDLIAGDTIHFSINSTPIVQMFTGGSSDATLTALSAEIDAFTNITSSVNFALRTITISSTVPGTPFSLGGLTLTTAKATTPVTANTAPQTEQDSITFNRPFQSGDLISLVINGNTITQSFTGDTDSTLGALALQIDGMSGIGAAADTINNKITINADAAGIWFSASNTTIVNSVTPAVLVAGVTPVKQTNTFNFPQTLLAGDQVDFTVDGAALSGGFITDETTTMSGISASIDALAGVNSSLNTGTKTFSINATNAGTPFSMSSVVTIGTPFTGSTLTGNTVETKASLVLDIAAVPNVGEDVTIGNCSVLFDSGTIVDTDCSDGAATLDISGISSVQTIAALLRGLSGVDDIHNGFLAMSGTGSQAIFTTALSQTSGLDINFVNNAGINIIATAIAPVLAVPEVDSITLARAFAPGDSFTIVVNGITVTQNFTSSHTTSLSNLNTQLNALPNIASVISGDSLILTATAAGTAFALGNAQFINTQNSAVAVSNTVGVAQKDVINFPSALVTGDSVHITINGTPVSVVFTTDSPTTLVTLAGAIGTAIPTVVTTLSGALGLVLEAATPGDTFSIDHLDVTNITAPISVAVNMPGIAQVDSLTIPFAPTQGDSLAVQLNGTTLTQAFTTDINTTLSLLNTQIDSLAAVNSSVDTGSGVFTITSATPGIGFSGGLLASGATINSTNLVENSWAQAQVDSLPVNRVITPSDTLTLAIDGTGLVQTWNTDAETTLGLLNTQIDALASVDSSFNGSDTFTITASASGTSFVSGVLIIDSVVPSVNTVPNVPAQTQIDQITLPRALIAGDTVSFDLDGTTFTQIFTGGTDVSTLSALQSQVNTLTGASLDFIGNVLTFTAHTAGIPFVVSTYTVQNSVLPVITVANVAPVKQQTEFTLPAFIVGDTIDFTLNASSITQIFTTGDVSTVVALVEQVALLNIVDTAQSGSILNMTSKIAGTAFALSSATVTNTVAPITAVVNVPAQAQVVDMSPGGPVIEGLTYRATINAQNYDYLTLTGDTSTQIINGLAGLMETNTGITVATGANLQVTSATPGIGFTYATAVLDITPPIASAPINAPETLKSGTTSTSTVESNEDGMIYMVLSGTTINTVGDIAIALSANHAFIAQNGASKNTPYTVTVISGVADGLYNIVAVDGFANVSQVLNGWLTVDNTAPVVTIETLAQTVNTTTITITGSTQANVTMDVTGGTSTITGTSAPDGSFSFDIPLAFDTPNVLTVRATDAPGNIGSNSVTITQDSLMPSLTINTSAQSVNTATITISGSTDPNIATELLTATGVILASGTSDGSGNYALIVALGLNQVNVLTVRVTDAGTNTNSGNISIVQDSINPNIILDSLPTATASNSILVSGTTEANASVVLTNGTGTVNTVATNTGFFTANVPLQVNVGNMIDLSVTDLAGNIGTGSVAIIQDSIPNALIIATPNQMINAANLTITGSTKPNAQVSIAGGSGAIVSGVADNVGIFSLDVSLARNALNALTVSSTDQVLTTVTGAVTITEDSTNPVVGISTPTQTTYSQNIAIDGTTEANAMVSITGGSGASFGVSDETGNFSINTALNTDALNPLLVTVTDQAGNIGTGSVDITHDPIVIFLTMDVVDQSTNTPTFTFIGTTKSGATIAITGGSGTVNLIAPFTGGFTGTVILNPNQPNNILVTATDATLTSATGGFTITHDTIPPALNFVGSPTAVNTASVTLTGLTDPGANLTITNGTGIYTVVADGSGIASFSIPLIQNQLNTMTATPTDPAGNVGSGVVVNVTHDNLGAVVSNLGVTPFMAGPIMTAAYSFTTSEVANATFSVGTGANVSATLIATGVTNGTLHAGAIPGLLATQTYFYFVTATDTLGNSSATPVGAINSIDIVGPVLSNMMLGSVTSNATRLTFSYSDAHATAPFMTGAVSVNDGVTTTTFPLSLSFGNMTNTGSSDFTGLAGGTTYTYNFLLKDDFGNGNVSTGTFVTATRTPLTGGVITQTGAINISLSGAVGNTVGLSGTTINLISNPLTSGVTTGSLVSSGVTSISFSGAWNGVIAPPSLLNPNAPEAASNAEIASLVTVLNTPSFTFAGTVIQTIQAGSDTASLFANGGVFAIKTSLGGTSYSGQTLHIYRSSNGINWQINTPSATCIVASDNTCAVNTDHLSYFAFASVTSTPVVVVVVPPIIPRVVSSGGGGGWASLDYCPAGDYSSSYYDRVCGTAPIATQTGVISSSGNTTPVITPSDISGVNQDGGAWVVTPSDPTKLNNSVVNQLDRKIKTIDVSKTNALDFAKAIINSIYTRTLHNGARMTIMNSLIRYTSTQADRVTTVEAKWFFLTLRNTFMHALNVLKQEAALWVTTIPNLKKNNTSTAMITLSQVPGATKVFRYINTETFLTIRSAPNFSSDAIGYAFPDERVEVLAMGVNWSEVSFHETTWFVRTRLLRKTQLLENNVPLSAYQSTASLDRAIVRNEREGSLE